MKAFMETLNYEVLAKSGYNGYILKNAPEKVLQFGEGNFLRAFVDYWFDLANEKADWNGKCVLVQPIAPGLSKMINEQEGLYTLYLRGSGGRSTPCYLHCIFFGLVRQVSFCNQRTYFAQFSGLFWDSASCTTNHRVFWL